MTRRRIVVPPPRLVAGTPDAWTLDPWRYLRARRSFYLPVTREQAVYCKKRLARRRRVPLHHVMPAVRSCTDGGLWEGAGNRTFSLPEAHWRELRVNVGPPNDEDAHIEVLVPDEVRTADLLMTWVAGYIMREPPWYRDMVAWFRRRTAGQRGSDETATQLDDLDGMSVVQRGRLGSLVPSWAADQGIGLLLYDSGTAMAFSPVPGLTVIGSWPDGLQSLRHRDLVIDAALRGLPVSEEMLVWHYVRKEPRFDLAQAPADDAERTFARLRDLLTVMRQRERTHRQDLELDLLGIQAVRRMYAALGRLDVALGYPRGVRLLLVAREFLIPGPGVAGRRPPADMEGWPDALVELSAHEARPVEVRTLDDIGRSMEIIVRKVREGDRNPAPREWTTHINAVAERLRFMLNALRWPRGMFEVEKMLAVEL